ncbi:MAG: hypothetical protein MI757_03545, partial [Pirellulales bacterium]|nr:hypothetical protein [Pirellulales bacterium]
LSNASTAQPQPVSRSAHTMRATVAEAVVQESHEPEAARRDDQRTADEPQPLSLFSGVDAGTVSTSAGDLPLDRAIHLQPAFEVDQVVWPEVCQTLSSEIGQGIDSLLQQIASKRADASTVIGLLGVEPGSGCTTVTLTMAHRTSHRHTNSGAELLVIDANLHNSQIAQAVGLAPQACWKETDDQQFTLADALIESIADRLVVMPLASDQRCASTPLDAQRFTRDVQSLVSQYRSTFVDMGSYEQACERGTLRALAPCVDAVLLIQDKQAMEDADVHQVAAHVGDLGIEVAGVIHNRCLASSQSSMVA